MKITKTVIGAEPVALDEVKEYLSVTHDDQDEMIDALITSARQTLELHTGLSLVKTVVTVQTVIHDSRTLPYGPVQEITSITIDGEDVSDDVECGVIEGEGVLEAEYVAGPYPCELALKELIMYMYENRGGGVEYPPLVKTFIQNNTRNLWLQ